MPNGKQHEEKKVVVQKQIKTKEEYKIIERQVIEMIPLTPEMIQTIDDKYYSQEYLEGEEIELDDYAVALDYEDQDNVSNSMQQIEEIIKSKSLTLKRVDFT